MKIRLLPLFLLFSTVLQAQYYYNDIIGLGETNRQMQAYLSNNVKAVTATGTDNKGTKATDFSEFYEIRENGSLLKATSITGLSKTVLYSRFNANKRIISLEDSASSIINSTTYVYDDAGRVIKIQNKATDQNNPAFNQVETHLWTYDTEGKPITMLRIMDNTAAGMGIDSLEIRFVKDEDGNIGEERTYRRGIETGYLYYYYDDQNRLTDIVRYNKKLARLIPDIMFEYDEQDRVIQKITTTSDLVVGYLIWRYIFNDKGLKTKEALFNNDKKLTGKIDYNYSFL